MGGLGTAVTDLHSSPISESNPTELHLEKPDFLRFKDVVGDFSRMERD